MLSLWKYIIAASNTVWAFVMTKRNICSYNESQRDALFLRFIW